MVRRTFLIVLLAAALVGCPQPKDPDNDGGEGDGTVAGDSANNEDAKGIGTPASAWSIYCPLLRA